MGDPKKDQPLLEVNLRAQDHVDNAGMVLFKLRDVASTFAEGIKDQQQHYAFIGKEYAMLAKAYDDMVQDTRVLNEAKYGKDKVPYEEQVALSILGNKAQQCCRIAKNLSSLGRME